MSASVSPPWTELFAEISLRALLRLHHNYLSWSIKQTWSEEVKAEALNRGPGVALADELTVCAAISQEFLASRFPAAYFVGGNEAFNVQAGERQYRLTREVQYSENQNMRCDFCIERVDTNARNPRRKSLIEAKRAFLWTTKLDGNLERPTNQKLEVSADIKKLVSHEKSFESPADAPRGYVLVWNITDAGQHTNIGPQDYGNELAKGLKNFTVWQTKAVPLSVKLPLSNELRDWEVESWLWLILAEVTNKEKGSLKGGGGLKC